jgi:aminoglycoside phosphotransferase (APT) family kinase protein
MNEVLSWVAEITGAERVVRSERIQMLWSGYGELSRVHLHGGATVPPTVIVKVVRPPVCAARATGADTASHTRKVRSYDVEAAFYRAFSARCDDTCPVPKLLGARKDGSEQWLLLSDLDALGFGARAHDPRGPRLLACVEWLAAFHARFLHVRPEGLWKEGTYWHLGTRRDELANIRDASVRDSACELDRRLREARFQTLVHGDAKPDNFCFSPDGRSVAAVDFQYVGGGAGIRDVAYLLHGASPSEEAAAVEHYFTRLRGHLSDSLERDALERDWRELRPVAHDDFRRFLAGWRR